MNNGITVITTTGGRAEAFSLLCRWMDRQLFDGPIQWIAAYDILPHVGFRSIRSDHIEFESVYNQTEGHDQNEPAFADNYLSIIDRIKYDHIILTEDDDWYSPLYLQRMYEGLQKGDICGDPMTYHYHVGRRLHHQFICDGYCSLFHTGFNRSYLDTFADECRKGSDLLDMRFWRACRLNNSDKCKRLHFNEYRDSVGVKGLPGRAGLGVGHTADGYGPDPDLKVLTRWIGHDDAMYYARYWDGF